MLPFNAAGGDTLAIVEASAARRRRSGPQAFARSIVLLDADRVAQDGDRALRAQQLAQRERIDLVFSRPCIEATFLRLHLTHETRAPTSTAIANAELMRVWPDYAPPPLAADLHGRFVLGDLLRLARIDADIRRLVEVIGLGRFPR